MRKIYIIGDIDEAAYEKFSLELAIMEKKKGQIDIELTSEGGSDLDALAFYGRMRISPNRLVVSVYGYAQSAATLVLAGGCHRRMAKEAWVMVHESSADTKGSTSEVARRLRQSVRMEEQWVKLMEERTSTSASKWAELDKAETYLTALECLELGLIDEVF